MPFTGSSRALGLTTFIRTSSRCENRSALCTFSETSDSWGGWSSRVDAQAVNSSAASAMPRRSRRPGSGMAMRQHIGRHQHHALLGNQELLAVLGTIEADARARRDLAVLVDDGIADLAFRTDAHVREYHGTLDDRALFDSHAREQQRLPHRGAGDDHAARH